jgi:hypothetical protein
MAMAEHSRWVLAGVLSGAWLAAQDGEGLPTEHVRLLPPGAWVDLDTGLVLPAATFRKDKADLYFDRDGAGFYLLPVHGGLRAAAGATQPPDELPSERVRIGRHDAESLVLFARTDRGMARVELLVTDPYSTASASLRWVVVPPKEPTFLPPPQDLLADWRGDALEVAWHGDQPRWLVEVATGDQVVKHTVDAPRIALRGLDPKARHRIVVRGLGADHVVTMPAAVVQHGPHAVPVRGIVEYPDRWYGATGGLALSRGEAATDDAEVVFYLYGVSVPGGGVVNIGQGERTFDELHRLPDGAYPPTYGRLDDHDVLAIRTADGRYGKVWLEPAKANDVRSGMRVHFVFLPDGRRTLLAPPRELVAAAAKDGQRLAWTGDPGANFRVSCDGKLVHEGTATSATLRDLPRDRVFACEVVAVGADGEVSAPARTVVHTYGPEARFAQVRLESGQGLSFVTGQAKKTGDDADLTIVSSAGGSSFLRFQAAAGMAAAGELEFGDLVSARGLSFDEHFDSDDRRPHVDRFFVRTRDGGIATVRIVQRRHPDNLLEYLWVPKR